MSHWAMGASDAAPAVFGPAPVSGKLSLLICLFPSLPLALSLLLPDRFTVLHTSAATFVVHIPVQCIHLCVERSCT